MTTSSPRWPCPLRGATSPQARCRTVSNETQETAFLVQFALKVRFLVFDFGVFAVPAHRPTVPLVVL
eukprot:1759578-Rhodomonas_salina.1